MGQLYIAFTTLLLAYGKVEGVPSDCGQTYQTQLQNLITLKGNCDVAAFRDCCQVKELVSVAGTGTYEVNNPCDDHDAFSHSRQHAQCDMETDGGGWMVIQRRINGSVDFYRNWNNYTRGFGDLEGEFWYGLENIHCLTTRDDVELRIELGNGTTPSIVWTYQLFRVGGAATDYVLTIGEGQGVGSTFNAMAGNNGIRFSTRDSDNDASNADCASQRYGAWWYSSCGYSNINGRYQFSSTSTSNSRRLSWYTGSWATSHFTKVQMKIRPKRCSSSSSCN